MKTITTFVLLTYAVVAQSQPVIVTQPQGQPDISGATINLSVTVTGTGLKYQWRKESLPLIGKTSSSCLITNFSTQDVGDYDVVVTNTSGSVTSSVATLTLEAGYMFTTMVGLATNYGNVDGVGTSARFSNGGLRGMVMDKAGNLYAADAGYSTIRRITPAGEVTTFAGSAGQWGSADGTNCGARFNTPSGLAINDAGDIFVADWGNQTIRKVTAEGIVTTLAGKVGVTGTADGTGTNATFTWPAALTLDTAGNLYVAQDASLSMPLRRISPAGEVTTLTNILSVQHMGNLTFDAGGNLFAVERGNRNRIWKIDQTGSASVFAGQPSGYADGINNVAAFNGPWGVASDGQDNLILVDVANDLIRKVATNGIASTLAGRVGTPGSADGAGSDARFYYPWNVFVDHAGVLYVADGYGTIRKGINYTGAPFIVGQPQCQAVALGSNVTFSITVTSAVPVSCQWQFQGADLPGATNTSLTLINVQLENVGNYRAFVINELGADASILASLGILGQPVTFSSAPNDTHYAADGLHLRLTGLVGQGQIVVYASTNLITWVPTQTNYAGFGSLNFVDPQATNFTRRFYRAAVPAAP